jgi:hypothetical protein
MLDTSLVILVLYFLPYSGDKKLNVRQITPFRHFLDGVEL